MSLLNILGGLLGPVGNIIDDLHTSGEEKLAAKAQLLALEAQFSRDVLEYEQSLAKEQAETIRAEMKTQSWLAMNWRPITMLVFVYIIAHNYVLAQVFSLQVLEIPPDMWGLLKIGLGGYVVGRSAEKIIPATMAAMKKRSET